MASTYSTNLKIELITTGEQLNTWGVTTNNNLGTAIEQAIVGRGDVTFTNDADLTLVLANSNVAQPARAYFLDISSSLPLTAPRDLIVPTIEKPYAVHNRTTGGEPITIKTAAGSGVIIPNGARMLVYVDGVNVVQAANHFNTLTAVSPAFTGTPTAPTANPGTNTTQLATTAFVQALAGNLGTMSQQNANNVNITGGSVAGITDLAVADGGTGASTAANARTNLGLGTIATQNANAVAITGGTITGGTITGGTITSGTITGGTVSTATLTNNTYTNYTESVVDIGTVSSSNTISLTNGTVQIVRLTANTTCAFTMPTATAGKSFILFVRQAATTGNGNATFTGVKWSAFGTPTITATANRMDILTFVADGTNWYGSFTQGYTL